MPKLKDTAAMHASLNHSLTKAERALEKGFEIPWAELEEAVELALKHGVATQQELDAIRAKELSLPGLHELLDRIKAGYGNPPKAQPIF